MCRLLTRPAWLPPQVVQEVYDEIVLWQPTEDFFNRYATHTARPAPPSQLAQARPALQPELFVSHRSPCMMRVEC